jgi:hypothetical protein
LTWDAPEFQNAPVTHLGARSMLDKFPMDAGRSLEFVFAKRRDDRAFRKWLKSAPPASNPKVLDAMELGTLAFRRWREAVTKKRVADCVDDIKDYIEDNPHAEITVLILVRAPWLKGRNLVGLCHFRRTWCNNIYIDFLTKHPSLIGRHKEAVRGVGTALLYFIACVAADIKAGTVWGEATQNSAKFYRKVFEKPEIKDLIFLDEKDYTAFRNRVSSDLHAISNSK